MGMCIGPIVIAMNVALLLLTYWFVCWLALVSCPSTNRSEIQLLHIHVINLVDDGEYNSD